MKTILFRGQSIETNEWVYGNYMEKIDPHKIENTFLCCFIQDMAITATKVIPETVGQFTGLLDKNKTKIFEGDVVIVDSRYEGDFHYNGFDGEVLFDDGSYHIAAIDDFSVDSVALDKESIHNYSIRITDNIHNNNKQ